MVLLAILEAMKNLMMVKLSRLLRYMMLLKDMVLKKLTKLIHTILKESIYFRENVYEKVYLKIKNILFCCRLMVEKFYFRY